MKVEDRLAVPRHLRGVGLAVKHSETPAVPFRRLDLKASRREGEEIRRERLRLGESQADPIARRLAPDLFAVGERRPRRGDLEAEGVLRLEIGLIEAGERETCPGWNEERVRIPGSG